MRFEQYTMPEDTSGILRYRVRHGGDILLVYVEIITVLDKQDTYTRYQVHIRNEATGERWPLNWTPHETVRDALAWAEERIHERQRSRTS